MTKVLTRDEVVSTLRDIIREKGADFVYRTERPQGRQCMYKNEGAPSCIVGHLVARLDPETFEAIDTLDGPSNFATSWSIIDHTQHGNTLPSAPLLAESHELAGAIRSLQAYQDNDMSWGQSFQAAFGEVV